MKKIRKTALAKYVLSVLILLSFAVLQLESQAFADGNTKVLVCRGTEFCSTCSDNQKMVDFTWTYTVDFSAGTVNGVPAKISDDKIAWQPRGGTALDEREIDRYSKRFHFSGKDRRTGAEFYYGDGTCEVQEERAF